MLAEGVGDAPREVHASLPPLLARTNNVAAIKTRLRGSFFLYVASMFIEHLHQGNLPGKGNFICGHRLSFNYVVLNHTHNH